MTTSWVTFSLIDHQLLCFSRKQIWEKWAYCEQTGKTFHSRLSWRRKDLSHRCLQHCVGSYLVNKCASDVSHQPVWVLGVGVHVAFVLLALASSAALLPVHCHLPAPSDLSAADQDTEWLEEILKLIQLWGNSGNTQLESWVLSLSLLR